MPINEPKFIPFPIPNIDPKLIEEGIKKFKETFTEELKEAGFTFPEPEASGEAEEPESGEEAAVRVLKLAEQHALDGNIIQSDALIRIASTYLRMEGL